MDIRLKIFISIITSLVLTTLLYQFHVGLPSLILSILGAKEVYKYIDRKFL